MTGWKARTKAFTLIEVLVAFSLISLIASLIGWKSNELIQKKKISSAKERLKSSLVLAHHLSRNTGADWECIIEKEKEEYILQMKCLEGGCKEPPPVQIHVLSLNFNGKNLDKLTFLMTSGGRILPHGVLCIRNNKNYAETLRIPQLFSLDSGSKGGPKRPDSQEKKSIF